MAPALDPAIAAALARGVTVITPNQRAARAIRRAFDAAQQATGVPNWQPANALPLDAWLAQLWRQRIVQGVENRILVNRSQEHVLWHEVIASDSEAASLRSIDSLADLAARAWSLLHAYNGRSRLRDFSLSTDSRAFERWSRAFERRLERTNLITQAQLPAELASARNLSAPSVALIDFDFVPPALKAFFEALQTDGGEVIPIQTQVPRTTAQLHTAHDDSSELAAAARWARTLLGAKPDARIAIVVPDLEKRHAAIERAFASVLTSDSPYEFSLGRPLADLSIATSALALLTWPNEGLSIAKISELLLSPWFASKDNSAVAEFDAFELRQLPLLRPELSLDAAIHALEQSHRRRHLGDLLLRLRNLQKAALPQGKHSFLRCSESFRTLLDAAGWTHNARTSSLAFQQHRRFESALDELVTLDLIAPEADFHHALTTLNRILGSTVFAPESSDAPIQILGPLELGGIPFDALWFLGADDLAWPPSSSPNPLLAWQLQRALAMPGSDSANDDNRGKILTARVVASAITVVFSYARQSNEGIRRPSPVLRSLDLQLFPEANSNPLPAPLPLEEVSDDTTLPPLPTHEVRGGAQILKLQAACAFRAFAERRLHSTQPDAPTLGFDALERGTLVHAVMQFFWTELQTQQALSQLTSEQQKVALDRAINQALARSRAKPETAWDQAYLSVQRERLHLLLAPWLKLERSRPAFSVQPPEQKQHIQLGGLTLELRFDRIDSTEEGDIILDYKTGDARPSQWQGERPDEPQLPLYAILHAQRSASSIAGVAFALLRPGEDLSLKGFAEDPEQLAGSKPAPIPFASLAEQIEDWHRVLSDLAISFASGDTFVAPKSYPQTCKHCGQRILCRLKPELLLRTDDVDQESEAADV